MTETFYPSTDDVHAINALILSADSQSSLLLNQGALESALLRAQMAAHYQQADIIVQAALLMAGIAFAHAFLDGNKRTAVVAGVAFLNRNGWRVTAVGDELGRQVLAMIHHAGTQDEAAQQFLVWLRIVTEPLP